jgi:hypothetical protein
VDELDAVERLRGIVDDPSLVYIRDVSAASASIPDAAFAQVVAESLRHQLALRPLDAVLADLAARALERIEPPDVSGRGRHAVDGPIP